MLCKYTPPGTFLFPFQTATAGLEAFKDLAEQCLSLSKVVMKKLGPMFMEYVGCVVMGVALGVPDQC